MLNFDLARKRRKWLELTQEQVAKSVGIDHTTLSKWEAGERRPSLEHLEPWAKALDLSVGMLLGLEPAPATKEAAKTA